MPKIIRSSIEDLTILTNVFISILLINSSKIFLSIIIKSGLLIIIFPTDL